MSNQVLTAPNFSCEEASKFLKKNYGLQAEFQLLPSERDQNFKCTDNKGNECVLKISNLNEQLEFLKMQIEVIRKINANRKDAICPEIILSNNKEEITSIKNNEGYDYYCRLLTFIPGVLLSEYENIDDVTLKDLGKLFGQINSILDNYYNPAANRYFLWDLQNVLDIRFFLNDIDDINRRQMIEHFLQQFEINLLPITFKLRKSIIHNDGNDNNILFDPATNKLKGIIDFGDMIYSYTVSELAVLTAYILFKSENILETTCTLLRGYHSSFPLNMFEARVLFHLICARLCISVCISAHQSKLNPENKYLSVSERQAWKTLEKLVGIDPEFAANEFLKVCGFAHEKFLDKGKIIDIRNEHFGKSLSISYKRPIKIVKGFQQYLYDENGRRYLDCVNNVCHVGHCHPEVVSAANKQTNTLNTNTRYLHDNITNYGERLTSLFPDPLNVCFLVCSGSEANELAIRLARTYTKRKNIIVVDHAYHGNTTTLVDISPYKCEGPGGQGLPLYVRKVSLPDCYRGEFKYSDPDAGEKYAEEIKSLCNNWENVGAFICESLPGVAGQIILPQNYLTSAYKIIRENKGVCIADEVQVGFGRVGTHMWGYETQNVVPDIITLGKPIGNGHPMAAVITTKEIADAFANGMEYFNTFGGNPVSCAIGLSVLDIIEKENLQHHAFEVGNYFKKRLNRLIEKYSIIGDVRGLGLNLGIELVKDSNTLEPGAEEASGVVEKMKDRGILLSTDGPFHNVIKIKPPLKFSKSDVDIVIENLEEVLNSIQGKSMFTS